MLEIYVVFTFYGLFMTMCFISLTSLFLFKTKYSYWQELELAAQLLGFFHYQVFIGTSMFL